MTPPPVGPLTDLTGWRAFVHRSISPPALLPAEQWSGLDTEARSVDVQDRIGYHAELRALQTPDLHRIVATGRSLLVLNHRQYGARRGLLVSGAPTTGKSTAITQLGRAVELAFRRTRPRPDDGAPVVYLTMPSRRAVPSEPPRGASDPRQSSLSCRVIFVPFGPLTWTVVRATIMTRCDTPFTGRSGGAGQCR